MSLSMLNGYSLSPTSATDDSVMPWEDEDWIPRTKSGKQKTPNQIRNALQKYIDESDRTQTSIVQEMGVNNNSFRKFMNPKTYKDQWSAVQNGTYWSGARLLARVEHEKKTCKKRKGASSAQDVSNKKAKSDEKRAAQDLMDRIVSFETDEDVTTIYDSCPQLVKKIKDLLAKGVTKASFCLALGGVNNNSLARFLAGKKQDQCANRVYQDAYTFFEKQRLMEGTAKSKARLKNETEQGAGGFSKVNRSGRRGTWTLVASPSFRYEY